MRFVRGVAALVLLTSTAHAEKRHAEKPDPRIALADQLVAEIQTLEKTLATVDEKVSAAQAARLRRIRAAYRILRTPITTDATANDEAASADRMASARRRAAARLLLERDRAERELLADEAAQLRTAETTLRAANDHIPTLAAPPALLAPAKGGTIARRFGTLVHDRSKATLARRGIDFDVPPLTAAVAPADGIVRYAGPMRGLDQGVIVDHGDYFSVVAKLSDVAIPVGTKVLRGDRLGRVARQRVYFELRAKIGPGGLPIDPEPLLAR